jgi:hypothetical protein
MWFTSWLRKWKRSAPRAGAHAFPRQRPTFRPQLEALEDRIVPSFSSPLSIPVIPNSPFGPCGLVAADLTGNGKTDLVVGGGFGVAVLMSGTKAGTFKAPVFFGTNYGVNSIAVGDINNDGKPDIVVAENPGDSAVFGTPGVISVLLGNGQGGFGLPEDFPQGTQTNRVALADLNGDGLLDIVTDNSVFLNSNYQIAVMNQGSPPGWAGQTYNFSALNGLALGDLNGDGRPDIVAMGPANQIQVWLNNGAGGFTAGQVFGGGAFNPVPLGDNGVALGDVNGDGKLDLVTANGTSNSVSVFAGNGDGTFNTTTAQTYALLGAAYAVALGDFNQDGKLDIATPGANVLLNNGAGVFGTAQQVGPAGGYTALVVADLNGDGFPDLAQMDNAGATIYVLFNNAAGPTTGHKGHKG